MYETETVESRVHTLEVLVERLEQRIERDAKRLRALTAWGIMFAVFAIFWAYRSAR